MRILSPVARADSTNRVPRADLLAFGVAAFLLGAVTWMGYLLNQDNAPIYADTAPIFGIWQPHIGPGTPFAIAIAVAVAIYGPTLAASLSWRTVVGGGYLAALLWTFSLAMIDGWRHGFAERLTDHTEYLHDVPRVTDIGVMLREFTDHVLAGQPDSWTVHVSGHPPGVLLFYVLLDRIGLGGGAWGGVVSLVVGATVAVTVPMTVRCLAGESAARAAVPFAVLFPGAVWVGVSADGMFMGTVATGVFLLALGATRRNGLGDVAAVLGGVVLGWGIFLNYGLVLMGSLALTVILVAGRPRAFLLAVAGASGVVLAFWLAGFWWWEGYQLVIERYHQGDFAQRPYAYWFWGNLGALTLCAGPASAVILRRAGATTLRRGKVDRAVVHVAAIVGAAAVAVLAADLSGLSKAEVERIWLPFAIWLTAGAVLLPVRHRGGWLAVQAGTALLVNHLVVTNW